ncbi:MAG: DUF87 domain-containing protein [Candidatus Lokiarchaeota archaeon]|nr:DUF87 domain-containing protein [Candidatus Lokiarchaeota archaeon]
MVIELIGLNEVKFTTGIKEIFENTEQIGVIGSPSSTGEFNIDIIGTAVDKQLVGKICVFKFLQDGKDHYALGQISEVVMHNYWTQDPTMKGIIRQKGRVDPITERQDIHVAKMMVSSVFGLESNQEIFPSILGTVPPTGTPIKIFSKELLENLLSFYQKELFYLGRAYGTDINLPMWFKHFDNGLNGVGEAYHIGIFGKTGSGKSVLAKMMITAYSKHKNMSIFILDPQGEFSSELTSNNKLRKLIEKEIEKNIKIYTLHNLVLDYSDVLLQELLIASGFFDKLKIVFEDHMVRFVDEILIALNYEEEGSATCRAIKPWEFSTRECFKIVWSLLADEIFLQKIIFTKEPRERVKNAWLSLNEVEMYKIWAGVTNLFSYDRENETIQLTRLFEKTSNGNPLIVIDLSSREKPEDLLWNDKIQKIAINQFLSKITNQAQAKFKKGGNINSLVVIDEAHRLAPRGKIEDGYVEKIRRVFIDAVRTTRKFGLGWMFISQTLSSLHKEILNQVRIFVFGFGLAWGTERRALLEIIGGATESMNLYQNFTDPQSGLGKKDYPFMTIGPISPLSFSGTPLFFNALEYPKEFILTNFRKK